MSSFRYLKPGKFHENLKKNSRKLEENLKKTCENLRKYVKIGKKFGNLDPPLPETLASPVFLNIQKKLGPIVHLNCAAWFSQTYHNLFPASPLKLHNHCIRNRKHILIAKPKMQKLENIRMRICKLIILWKISSWFLLLEI